MIQHVVLIRWKGSATEDQVRAVEALFDTFESIEGVTKVTVRRNLGVAKPEYTRGIGTVLIVSMKDRKTLEGFGPHPTHRAVAAQFMAAAEEVTIVDFDDQE